MSLLSSLVGYVIERVGAIASLGESTGRVIVVEINLFAELADDRRIVTNERHGSMTVQMWRHGIGAIYRRYYGPPVSALEELDGYRVRTTDVEDAVREMTGQLDFKERQQTWESPAAHLAWERRTGFEGEERRTRWAALLQALAEHDIRVKPRKLDRVPFNIEIDGILREQLEPRPEHPA